MRQSIFNNPNFSGGLARLVESYMPNPERELQIQARESQLQSSKSEAEARQAMAAAAEAGNVGEMMRLAMLTGGGSASAAARYADYLQPNRGKAGPRQYDPDIASEAAEAIAAGADPARVSERASQIQSMRDRGIAVGQ